MPPLTTKTPEEVLCKVGEMLGAPWETKRDCIQASEIAQFIDEYFDPDSVHQIIVEGVDTMLRAKFSCYEVSQVTGTAPDANGVWKPCILERVKLSAVSDARNKEWSAATPSGDLSMHISNPSACGFFKPGKQYYLDVEEAPPEAGN